VTAKARRGAPRPATLIPGDGIGPEVIDAAVQVMAAAGGRIAWDVQPAGKEAFEKMGTAIPEALLASIRRTRVGLKGPLETQIGRTGYRSVNVALRKTFDLFANVRPIRSHPGVRTAFSGVDLVVVRENTEDLYSGIEHTIAPGVVESVKVITARASRRIARFAFDLARRERRHKVVAIHKANIMKLSDGLFLACAQQVAKRHPRIHYGELIVCARAWWAGSASYRAPTWARATPSSRRCTGPHPTSPGRTRRTRSRRSSRAPCSSATWASAGRRTASSAPSPGCCARGGTARAIWAARPRPTRSRSG